MNKILAGCILALITAASVIFMIQTGRSLPLFVIGFVLFVVPVTFISSFKSPGMAFCLALFFVFTGYAIWSFALWDMIWGILLAVLIGGSLYYFKIKNIQRFSTSEYKKLNSNPKQGI
jgi:hypothetical protein